MFKFERKEKKRIFEKLTFFAYSQQYLLETVTQKAICRGDKKRIKKCTIDNIEFNLFKRENSRLN